MADIVGITALVPPELVYATGHKALDLNNLVPECTLSPHDKLCAWTACWRELALSGRLEMDRLVVVAGGDCHNALVDGQKLAAAGTDTHYFFYPFRGETERMREETLGLMDFLGGELDERVFGELRELKALGKEIDLARGRGELSPEEAFDALISFSDMRGNPERFGAEVRTLLDRRGAVEGFGERAKVGLVGVPPINPDFHEKVWRVGLATVFDELPFEFIRLSGRGLDELVESYATYTFARELDHRMELLAKELSRRNVEGVIHYTQYACHHTLEDAILRRDLGLPMLTVQGDLPRPVDQQLVLRLEAFAEMLGRR